VKVYTVDKPFHSWLIEHRDHIYHDVLTQCELKLIAPNGGAHIDVAILKTDVGETKFVIKDIEGILESLEKTMTYFVDIEEYELAARTRDCISGWKEIDK
jgi:hypothetical protein